MAKQYCLYYQAVLQRDKIWFIVGCLRNEDNFIFERALDKYANLFEFFVPEVSEDKFLKMIGFFSQKGFVTSFEKKPNRIMYEPLVLTVESV